MTETISATDLSPELVAMQKIDRALTGLQDEEIGRILEWLLSKYRAQVEVVGDRRTSKAFGRPADVEEEEPVDFASLYNDAGPSTDAEKALVAAYWLQVVEQNENLDGQSVNTLLKGLGYPVANITDAFTSLFERRPALAMQVRKSGTSKQARKKYRLTDQGIRKVKAMVSALPTEEE